MLDIVSAHQHKAAACVDGCGIEDLQARLAVTSPAQEGRRRPLAQQPEHDEEAQERQGDTQCRDQETIAVSGDEFFDHIGPPFPAL